MKGKHFKYYFIFLTFLIINIPVFSQGKFELSFGLGFEDGINAKIKYGKNFQAGVSQFLFYSSTAVEVYYHFGGKSEFTDQRPWYYMTGNSWHWHLPSLGINDDFLYQFFF